MQSFVHYIQICQQSFAKDANYIALAILQTFVPRPLLLEIMWREFVKNWQGLIVKWILKRLRSYGKSVELLDCVTILCDTFV